MSRDPRSPPGPGATAPLDQGAELLTAYVDGVAELSPDERRRVEAQLAGDPQTRADQAAVRALLDRLRDLPPEGAEPDWTALERSIRQAAGREATRPWWRSWKWLAPATMLATAAAVLLVMWARPAPVGAPGVQHATDRSTRDSRPVEDTVALWLDGAQVDVDLSASDLLGDADLGEPDGDDLEQPGGEADAELGLLPSTDLAWVDKLDEAAIDRAERWFARKKKG